MRDLAPEIYRQRELIEGRFDRDLDADGVADLLLGLAGALELETYGRPVVYAPASGQGRPENAGFDAFVPLIDSGIAGYFWTGARFFSVLIYACAAFDREVAARFLARELAASGELATMSF